MPVARTITTAAKLRPPARACDCHAHVFGPYATYPLAPGARATGEAPLEAYVRMHEVLGIERGVLIQPSYYGHDNSALLNALERTAGSVKGIVALPPEALTENEVARLDALGVRGVRMRRKAGVEPAYFEHLEAVAERIAGCGWHLEIVPPAIEPIVALRSRIEKLPVPVSFDQMGLPSVGRGIQDPAFQELLAMVRDGVVWVKLSHPYHLASYPYAEVLPFARALAGANPKRCVFALDWPHTLGQNHPPMPDDGFLLDLFAEWVPDLAAREQILVANAAELYRF